MHIICDKRAKKLLRALAALGAIACHANLGINNLKVFGFRNIPLHKAC